jgi:hypothetical protein
VAGPACQSRRRGGQRRYRPNHQINLRTRGFVSGKHTSNERSLSDRAGGCGEWVRLDALGVGIQEVVYPVLTEEAEVVEALASPRSTECTPTQECSPDA